MKKIKDTKKLRGIIHLKKLDVDGTILKEWDVENVITILGKATMGALAFMGGNLFTYLGVGSSNTAPANTQTTLGAEVTTNGFARSSAVASQTTTTTLNDTQVLTHTFVATANQDIEEIGFFNASSAGVMGGRALTGSHNFLTGQSLIASYSVIYS